MWKCESHNMCAWEETYSKDSQEMVKKNGKIWCWEISPDTEKKTKQIQWCTIDAM